MTKFSRMQDVEFTTKISRGNFKATDKKLKEKMCKNAKIMLKWRNMSARKSIDGISLAQDGGASGRVFLDDGAEKIAVRRMSAKELRQIDEVRLKRGGNPRGNLGEAGSRNLPVNGQNSRKQLNGQKNIMAAKSARAKLPDQNGRANNSRKLMGENRGNEAPSVTEIEESLRKLGDLPERPKGVSRKSSAAARPVQGDPTARGLREELSKKQQKKLKKLAKKQQKAAKPHRKRKIAKRIFLILILLAMVGAGYFVWKTTNATCKMTNAKSCNMFKVLSDVVTKRNPLKTDANGRTNVIVFGTSGWSMDPNNGWDGAGLTDSIMVISFSAKDSDAYMISLPRDLYVKHTCKNTALNTTAGKLNETYFCILMADNNRDRKPDMNENAAAMELAKTAGKITGLDIQYYVHADWTAAVQAVDAVGGIDVDIESTDKRGIRDQMAGIKFPNGIAHLNGQQALGLARARNHSAGDYGLAGGNFDREKNQQKILVALREKALSVGTLANPVAVNGLIDALGDNIHTNFGTDEIQSLINLAKTMNGDNIKSLPLVGRTDGGADLVTTGMYSGASIVLPVAGMYDFSAIQSYVAQNVSSNPVVREGAKIDVLNASNQVGFAKRWADELSSEDFTIAKTGNAPTGFADANDGGNFVAKIYQINAAKTATAEALAKKFGVKVISGNLANYTTTADFVVVVGENAKLSGN